MLMQVLNRMVASEEFAVNLLCFVNAKNRSHIPLL